MYKLFKSNKPNIAVLGDIMVDINIYGSVNKIANEDPVPVLLKNDKKQILGGCGNVLNNLFSLGCEKLYLLSTIGNDLNGSIITSLLKSKEIIDLSYYSNRITTTKNRFYSGNYLMFRYDEEDTQNISCEVEDFLLENLKNIIKKIDCLIISDYNKGVCTKRLCEEAIHLCNIYSVKTIIDPKKDYDKYKNCTLIKPNKKEASIFLNKEIESNTIEEDLKILRNNIECKYSLITLAEKGLVLYDGKTFYFSNIESREVIDVTGAGDVVCSVLGYLLCVTDNFEYITKISNYLASISVQHLGTYVLTNMDILKVKIFLDKNIDIEDIINLNQSKKVVFTNGCFDLLHKGHIECLKYAKSLGDVLVVGINNDLSVKKLKGNNRPIQDENTRMLIVKSLDFVDYVIMFSEDTPLNIIEKLKPSILVKGGDYDIDKIVGKEYVQEVKIFNYIQNTSTTNTIYKIINQKE